MSGSSITQLRKFVAPEFIFGVGALELVGRYARHYGARKVLVVTDSGVRQAGWLKKVTDSLVEAELPWTVFETVSPNPRAEEVMEGARVYATEQCNLIVALGGGSPLDCAKGIGIVSSNHRHICEFEGVDRVETPMPPLICIPTTSGSSADVSQFAIISDPERQVKIAIVSKTLVPDLALIDPMTLSTMPDYLCACTGMDALTHAIEACVSTAHSPITDLHGLEAIRLVRRYLPETVCRETRSVEGMCHLMLGSMEAGLAFSNAILGAVHAMAHSLGGLLDLPHGECNAILLGAVVEANFSACPERYTRIAAAMGLETAGKSEAEIQNSLLAEIRWLKETVGIRRTLGDIGLRREDISALAATALKDACMATNPREFGQEEVEEIYGKCF
ncbi:MAG TPA: alcohol dehydrogenase-like regulatory protein ErcA [Patescibacteria group bacterium]|nr:alcohol dehydrogenase-like regulatory protein ErcA [Patescibacteria group bacterium]